MKQNVSLARVHSPLRISDSVRDKVCDLTKTRKTGIRRLEYITECIADYVNYDHKHKFEGTRNAEDVWRTRKGHCLEQNILLHVACREQGLKIGWLVTKNPEGYTCTVFDDVGVHTFVTYLDGRSLYVADAVCGEVFPSQEITCMGRQRLAESEFVAFYLNDSAEDLITHGRIVEALELTEIALQIDPNNYTIHVNRGNLWEKLDERERAKKEYCEAIEKAPNLADPHEEYARFLGKTMGKRSFECELLRAASKKTTDLDVICRLERQLRGLGNREESNLLLALLLTTAEETGVMNCYEKRLNEVVAEELRIPF